MQAHFSDNVPNAPAVHGIWRIKTVPEHCVIMHKVFGSWNLAGVNAFAAEYLAEAKSMGCQNWAIISDAREFQLGPPEIFTAFQGLVRECFSSGASFAVQLASDHITQYVQNKASSELIALGSIKQVKTLEQAVSELHGAGFNLPMPELKRFFDSAASESQA